MVSCGCLLFFAFALLLLCLLHASTGTGVRTHKKKIVVFFPVGYSILLSSSSSPSSLSLSPPSSPPSSHTHRMGRLHQWISPLDYLQYRFGSHTLTLLCGLCMLVPT